MIVAGTEKETSRHRARSHLLVVTVGQGPVLLCGVEQEAQDVEGEAVLLVTGSLIRADEHAALELRICQHHNLRARGGEKERGRGGRHVGEQV